MFALNHFIQKFALAVGIVLTSHALIAFSQSREKPASSEQGEDVVRINTELVQTDVMVFDKRGRFVEGLRREDFELRIDGKPKPISFFDRVVAGSYGEEAQLAAALGGSSAPKERISCLATRLLSSPRRRRTRRGTYPLAVEYVGKVAEFDWITQVIVRLPDGLTNASDLLISINARGMESNQALISIK